MLHPASASDERPARLCHHEFKYAQRDRMRRRNDHHPQTRTGTVIRAENEGGHFRSPGEVLDHALAALKEEEHNRKGATRRKNLAHFLMESPLAGAELTLERQEDYGEPAEL